MLLLVMVMVLLIGIVLCLLGYRDWDPNKNGLSDFMYYHDDAVAYTGCAIIQIAGILLAIEIACIFCNYVGADAKVEQHQEKYNAISYKVESGVCRDEFGLLNKEVVDEIQEWNEDIVYHKAIQRDFWIGVFYPNIYDEFETIDYTNYSRE